MKNLSKYQSCPCQGATQQCTAHKYLKINNGDTQETNDRYSYAERLTSSNGTNTKGDKPLLCEIAGTSGLCVSSSCHPSTTPKMSTPSSLISDSFRPVVTSLNISSRLFAPIVVPRILLGDTKFNTIING